MQTAFSTARVAPRVPLPPSRGCPRGAGRPLAAEGGLMHNSPRLRRVMMPSRCIGAHRGVGGTSGRCVNGPQPT